MKIKIIRANGTTIDVEGSAEEVAKVIAAEPVEHQQAMPPIVINPPCLLPHYPQPEWPERTFRPYYERTPRIWWDVNHVGPHYHLTTTDNVGHVYAKAAEFPGPVRQ